MIVKVIGQDLNQEIKFQPNSHTHRCVLLPARFRDENDGEDGVLCVKAASITFIYHHRSIMLWHKDVLLY